MAQILGQRVPYIQHASAVKDVAGRLERGWNHPAEKPKRRRKGKEHVPSLIHKVGVAPPACYLARELVRRGPHLIVEKPQV